MVEGDGSAAKKYQGKCEGGQSEGKFVPVGSRQSVVEVHFGDSDGEIDADGERGDAGEQAYEDENAAEELSEGGDVGRPARKSEAGDEVRVVVKSAEDLVVTVNDDDGTECKTHD